MIDAKVLNSVRGDDGKETVRAHPALRENDADLNRARTPIRANGAQKPVRELRIILSFITSSAAQRTASPRPKSGCSARCRNSAVIT